MLRKNAYHHSTLRVFLSLSSVTVQIIIRTQGELWVEAIVRTEFSDAAEIEGTI
jgi:hypothetical protein